MYADLKRKVLEDLRIWRALSNTIIDLYLIDLPLQGYNTLGQGGRIMSKASQIDRFLISTKWNESFKIIKQLAVSRVISNHKLLLLESEEWYTTLLVYKILELVAATRRVYWHEEGVVEEPYDQWQPRFYPHTKIEELKKDKQLDQRCLWQIGSKKSQGPGGAFDLLD